LSESSGKASDVHGAVKRESFLQRRAAVHGRDEHDRGFPINMAKTALPLHVITVNKLVTRNSPNGLEQDFFYE
jgi:hypothetical protein